MLEVSSNRMHWAAAMYREERSIIRRDARVQGPNRAFRGQRAICTPGTAWLGLNSLPHRRKLRISLLLLVQ